MTKETIQNHAEKWNRTQNFVREAAYAGAFNYVRARGYTPRSWTAVINIIESYVWDHVVFEDLARIYGRERQSIHVKYRKGMHRVWKQSPLKLQEKYLFESLVLSKPSRAKMMAWERPSLTENKSRTKYEQLEEKLSNPNLTDNEAKRAMSKITRRFIQIQRRKESPLVVSLMSLLNESGLAVRIPRHGFNAISTFYEILKSEGIALQTISFKVKTGPQKGIQNNYFLWTHHIPRAIEAIQKISIS